MTSNKTQSHMVAVPNNMLDKVMQYMQTLHVNTPTPPPILETGSNECEVSRVIGSRSGVKGWEFRIVFKDKTSEWIKEENCFCENKIAEYLEGKGVKTAYLFCRVSTKYQRGNTSTSLVGQYQELKEAVKGKYQRIRVYNIRGSAYKSIPKEMLRVGEAARAGDSIWVWRVDRLSRNVVKYLSWLEDLNTRGIEIFAQSEDLQYSKKKLPFIQAIIDAQKEAAAIGERVKLSYKRKRERGDKHVGGLQYGKRYHRILSPDGMHTVRQIVETHPLEASIIREVCNSSTKEHPSVTAQRLNQRQRYKRGREWSTNMVKRCQKRRRI